MSVSGFYEAVDVWYEVAILRTSLVQICEIPVDSISHFSFSSLQCWRTNRVFYFSYGFVFKKFFDFFIDCPCSIRTKLSSLLFDRLITRVDVLSVKGYIDIDSWNILN